MIFNKHLELKDKHALLSGSKWHWINYDEERLEQFYLASVAAARGTELHEFAATCIRLGQKLPRSKKTLNHFVNDAIGFGMIPEQTLYFSEFCFGTADALCFDESGDIPILRIHDLKTGVTPAHMNQLYVYAALFCAEYNVKPQDIQTELRIYQNDDMFVEEADPEVISTLIKKMRFATKLYKKLSTELNAGG